MSGAFFTLLLNAVRRLGGSKEDLVGILRDPVELAEVAEFIQGRILRRQKGRCKIEGLELHERTVTVLHKEHTGDDADLFPARFQPSTYSLKWVELSFPVETDTEQVHAAMGLRGLRITVYSDILDTLLLELRDPGLIGFHDKTAHMWHPEKPGECIYRYTHIDRKPHVWNAEVRFIGFVEVR